MQIHQTYETSPPALDAVPASGASSEVHDPPPHTSQLRVPRNGFDPHNLPRAVRAPDVGFDKWMEQMKEATELLPILDALSKAGSPDRAAQKRIGSIICREEHHARALRAKTPAQWRASVDAILDTELRNAVARIVWWDRFGDQPYPERWDHLDEFLDTEYVPLEKSLLAKGLYQVGYSPWHATRRIAGTFDTTHKRALEKRSYTARKIPFSK